MSFDLPQKAKNEVRYAIRSAVYTADIDGLPTDSALRTAIQEAEVEQEEALRRQAAVEANLEASAESSVLKRPLKSASIGGASWTADDSASTIPYRYQIPYGGLCYSAVEILSHAGLLGGEVGVCG